MPLQTILKTKQLTSLPIIYAGNITNSSTTWFLFLFYMSCSHLCQFSYYSHHWFLLWYISSLPTYCFLLTLHLQTLMHLHGHIFPPSYWQSSSVSTCYKFWCTWTKQLSSLLLIIFQVSSPATNSFMYLEVVIVLYYYVYVLWLRYYISLTTVAKSNHLPPLIPSLLLTLMAVPQTWVLNLYMMWHWWLLRFTFPSKGRATVFLTIFFFPPPLSLLKSTQFHAAPLPIPSHHDLSLPITFHWWLL